MASRKELFFFMVDVGPSMAEYTADLSRMLFTFAEARLINKPAHEIAIVLFGTTETNNVLSSEQPGEYNHISVLRDLSTPGMDLLCSLKKGLSAGETGAPDFFDTLFVAMDMLIKAAEVRPGMEKTFKTFVVISDFLCQAKALDSDFRDALVGWMQREGVKLEVVSVDVAEKDSATIACKAAKLSNQRMLQDLVSEVKGNIRSIHNPVECMGLFKTKEIAPVGYKADFTIGATVKIKVRLYKKASRERPPSLKRHYSDIAEAGMGAASERDGGPVTSVEYINPSDPDTPIPSEETVNGYRYGKDLIPIDKFMEHDLRYQPDKCFQLIGFVDHDTIPRHLLLGDPSIVLADTDMGNQTALSALVRAMQRKKKAAVARIVQRANGKLQLVLLTPKPGSATVPDACIMMALPYAEDIRTFPFPPLAPKPEHLPTQAQVTAAEHLVKSMDLHERISGREMLQPEATPNPAMEHFYWALGCKALATMDGDDNACNAVHDREFENDNHLYEAIMEPQLQHMQPAAKSSLSAFVAAFDVEEIPRVARGAAGVSAAAGAAAAAGVGANGFNLLDGSDAGVGPCVRDISDDAPQEDFAMLLSTAATPATAIEAIESMCAKIYSIVEDSVMGRTYPKALSCMTVLRRACVDRGQPNHYNDLLGEIMRRYKGHDKHSSFVDSLASSSQLGPDAATRVMLPISQDEAPTSAYSAAKAEDFVVLHGAVEVAERTLAAATVGDDDGDLEDME